MNKQSNIIGPATNQEPVITKQFQITNPLLIMFEQDGEIICHIWPRAKDTYAGYGLMICDLVRHVASAFKVDEDEVWEWVDKERRHPTTDIVKPS